MKAEFKSAYPSTYVRGLVADNSDEFIFEGKIHKATEWQVTDSVSIIVVRKEDITELETYSANQGLIANIKLGYRYYPVLAPLIYSLTVICIIGLALAIFNIRPISPYLLFGLLVSTGGLVVVLMMASSEIYNAKKS